MRHSTTDSTWQQAADRCDFQLNYSRSPSPREFGPGEITGDAIDDAYRPGQSSPGEWAGDRPDMLGRYRGGDEEPDVQTWIDSYAAMAINEAVHEALEWFRVDGKPWLDPHGTHEPAIYDEVRKLCERLAEMRATTPKRRKAAL